jgi:hypothetical protein
MSCCGRRVTPAGGHGPGRAVGAVVPAATRPAGRQSYVLFEYVGRTGMTVIGGVSGRRYRFDGPGARVAVDPVDRASLAAVPHLRPGAGPI